MNSTPDLEYFPVKSDVHPRLTELRPGRFLVAGNSVPLEMSLCGECRILQPGDTRLPTGTYVFRIERGRSWILHVQEGADPMLPYQCDWDSRDVELLQPFGWFEAWWPVAHIVRPPAFCENDEVVLVPSGEEGRVRKVISVGHNWTYEVRVPGRSVKVNQDGLSELVVDSNPEDWIVRQPSPAERFAATLTRAKLRERLTDTVFSFNASRTLFRAYQFLPVIKLLATGRLRLLIADEVGLGKTIEAGLVWTEFDARNMANRVLIVCPASLVAKWRAEMRERFNFELTVLDAGGLNEFLEQVDQERLPLRLHAVCSLERLRAWEGLEQLAKLHPHFDLVIVDEAHAFRNSDSRSHALGELLEAWSDALIFLTATPLNLGNDDLFNLLELLDAANFSDRTQLEERLKPNTVLNRIAASLLDVEESNETRRKWLNEIDGMTFGPAVAARPEYSDLRHLLMQPSLTPVDVARVRKCISQLHALSAVVTRTRKAEIIEDKARREVMPIPVSWTPEEHAFYDAFRDWQFARAQQFNVPAGFITQMPLRLASSCLPMAKQRLLSGHWNLASEEGDDEQVPYLPESLQGPGSELQTLARAVGDSDTKYDAFLPKLKEIIDMGRRVLVFTFSRDTLAYLENRLRTECKVGTLHGGIAPDERYEVMRRFRNGEFDVVLATKVASEGLDFEFCSAVVNYDLPWNPMEVEQRIGRIDRFGQSEEVIYVVNFEMPGTIETDIVGRLMTRIGVFKDSIGELEPILRENLEEIKKVINFSLTDEQREQQLMRLDQVIEQSKLTIREVENASFLASTDGREIDGLEMDLRRTGRYVGQEELRLLIQDWAEMHHGSTFMSFSEGKQFVLRGTVEMEAQLLGVQSAGERSLTEIERLASKLRDEVDIPLQLDSEFARRNGGDLLSANHPLVRAALKIPGHKQHRFASLRFRAATEDKSYLVVLAVVTWEGVRRSTELWAEAVPLDGGDQSDEIGDALLSALAEGALEDEPIGFDSGTLAKGLERATYRLLLHQNDETERRLAENHALAEDRRISLEDTYDKKVDRIKRAIETLKANDNRRMVSLQEAQLQSQRRELDRKLALLREQTQASLGSEIIAVCVITKGRGHG